MNDTCFLAAPSTLDTVGNTIGLGYIVCLILNLITVACEVSCFLLRTVRLKAQRTLMNTRQRDKFCHLHRDILASLGLEKSRILKMIDSKPL